MPFKLSKHSDQERAKLTDALRLASNKVNTEIEALNAALQEHRDKIEAAVEEYNGALQNAREFTEGIVSQADDEIGERSDKWQDSEKGQAAVAWKDEWEGIDLEDLEIEVPDDLDLDEPSHADDIDALPTEAE